MRPRLAVIILIIFFITLVILVTTKGGKKFYIKELSNESNPTTQPNQSEKPQIVSTKPDPLNEAIIPAEQIVEITFNRPLENVGEFKVRIDPKIDFKIELSGDRKTGKIIPAKPYELGQGYTLFIGSETKFDGVGRWGEEKIFHFRTIKYRGI